MSGNHWVEIVRKALGSKVSYFSIRHLKRRDERLAVRLGVLEPPMVHMDEGVMITVIDRSGLGYAATSDLSDEGLTKSAEMAKYWADQSSRLGVIDFGQMKFPHPVGRRVSDVAKAWNSSGLHEKVERLKRVDHELGKNPLIVDRNAAIWNAEVINSFWTSDGGAVVQENRHIVPQIYATAARNGVIETRSLGAQAYARQGGLELLDELNYDEVPSRLREEALELSAAPHCPTGDMDLLLDPDQMILQIHESIGHPLELDRILGDERNFAGTSFVTKDMFGSYRYGSDLLNVSFDPSIRNELASYDFDDDGSRAEKTYLIKDGILQKPLGAAVSQQRSGLEGVANSRADNWNRPPIDRMANLNLEPGQSSLDEMISSVERGVYMKTNCSWSIDDSRNKFQFGCEWARLIENGKLTALVRKPNYRGISATFWRSLKAVGNQKTNEVLGTPYCGKGEPNQVITVGHATPACLFEGVQVFGGV